MRRPRTQATLAVGQGLKYYFYVPNQQAVRFDAQPVSGSGACAIALYLNLNVDVSTSAFVLVVRGRVCLPAVPCRDRQDPCAGVR